MRVDKEGYLLELADWNQTVATELALREGLTLTPEHWAVIELLRDFHHTTGVSLSMRALATVPSACRS